MASNSFVFAHLADAHVGAWSRDPVVRRALRESVLKALRVVEERDCEFLLISGDLFHTPVPEPSEVAPVAAGLRALVERGRRVYVIYGSHDYVAHRTSWLDVLAETGLFLRASPEAVRAEGDRWTLPFLVDPGTGAVIAGISGRSHGLDRSYFAAVDTEAFRATPGFRIFQFHAAIDEYLPEGMREHIHGISRMDLPGGCDYYAGGHIHYSYLGTGPDGGLLVNPGAVFGTSLTDLKNGADGRTHQGVVIVTVESGVPRAEFVDTAPRDLVRVFDVDISGQSVEQAKEAVQGAIQAQSTPGGLLFPRLHGVLADGTLGGLGLHDSAQEAAARGAGAVHWDIRDVTAASPPEVAPPADTADPEGETVRRLIAEADPRLTELSGAIGERRVRELLHSLGEPKSEGEAKHDYATARVDAALRIIGLKPPAG
ncbi:MAG: metallophosphoesterase [Thermoplasmata archaeon]|nr:metallophosphoesterase [Thermoplasmata archaeon]